MIEIKGLCKNYGALRAVDNLSLTVEPGEIFGFLGPNGAGKTTTIQMLTGLLKPTAGDVFICGRDLERQPAQAKSLIGYLHDEPVLYERLSGREFLEFSGELYRIPLKRQEERITELLEMFELTDRADDYIQAYSRGMRKKLALAAALLHEPRVLVMDEPTSALDPKNARLLKSILKTMAARGAAVFMSTHILEIAEHMCTRVGIIDRGKLVACGSMSELRRQSRSDYDTLEDIFLKITGGAEYSDIISLLGEDGAP